MWPDLWKIQIAVMVMLTLTPMTNTEHFDHSLAVCWIVESSGALIQTATRPTMTYHDIRCDIGGITQLRVLQGLYQTTHILYHSDWGSETTNMNTLTIVFLLFTFLQLSCSLFFGGQTRRLSEQIRTCRTDRDCPRLPSGGRRCKSSTDVWCQLTGEFWSRYLVILEFILQLSGGRDCSGSVCLLCLNDRDCGSNKYCSGGICLNGSGNRITGDCSSDRDCDNIRKCPLRNHCECKIIQNRGTCESVRCFSKFSCTKFYDSDCENGFCTKNYIGK